MSYYTSIIILVLLSLGTLSVLIFENDRIPKEKKTLFVLTNLLIAVSALAECAGIHIGQNENIPSFVLSIVKAIDYTLTPLTGGALILLMRTPNKKWVSISIASLFIGNAIFQIISAFTGWMVVIDEHNNYTHGPLYPVYIGIYCVVLVILAIKLVLYGKTFRKQNRVSLYATIALILIGILMQEILGREFRVAYIALTFGSAYFFIHYSEFSNIQMDDKITEQSVMISKDALTGVYSRFAYVEALKSFETNTPQNFNVFVIDINGLKAVNDSIGHEAGDEMICGAAECISATIGKNDQTFRIGGDEFVVFTVMSKDEAEDALKELDKVTKAWSGSKVKELTVSAGYAFMEDYEGISIEELVKKADKAMYVQKNEYYKRTGIDRRRY